MDITFRTNKTAKTFNSDKELQKEYGSPMAKVIKTRLATLKVAETLDQVPATPPDRRHQLKGNRDEQYAVDLKHPYRLVFEPNHDPIPRKEDGGIDLKQVNAITVIEVIDYH